MTERLIEHANELLRLLQRSAWSRGRWDYNAGIPMERCPYQESFNRVAWTDGWIDEKLRSNRQDVFTVPQLDGG